MNQSLNNQFTQNLSQVGRTLSTAILNAIGVDGQIMQIKPALSVSEELHLYERLKVRAEGLISFDEVK